MNIKILTANLRRIGGEQRVAIEEIIGLKNKGYNVKGYSFLGTKDFWILKGIPIIFYPNLKLPLLKQSFNCWLSWYLPPKTKGDILICHGNATFPIGHKIKNKLSKIKYIPYFHTLYGYAHPLTLFRPFRNFAFHRMERKMLYKDLVNADHIITNSTFMTDRLLNIHPNLTAEITVIHPGVKEPKKPELHIRRKKLGFTLTRIHRGKQLEFLLEVIKEIPDIKWIIAGAITPHIRIIRKKILDLKLKERVKILPSISEELLEYLYYSACVFVHANVETFGMPALEALVHGCPIVHPYPSGIWDVAQDGIQGYQVEQNNREDFVDKINKILENPPLRAKMSEKGKDLINKVSWNAHLDALEDLINSSISPAS
ncbi:glycosyltransferase family 4 protein [Candidatus Borrarchaeum sp.]|uniref:glycosyltransferase family 4 protein n=1 Tax=Candidatus Borrarchaeum sp. TaxID=2846742 RepID=UPI00257D28F4|nr:glycosyltransferase family 4 protein [Candidatus Borrarchaeum sp.]